MTDMNFAEWIENVGNCYEKLTNDERNQALDYLIQLSDASQLYFLSKKLNCLLKRDFIVQLPRELTFHLLQYLDPRSLLHCCCVSRQWNVIINSCCVVWRDICIKAGIVVDSEQKEAGVIKQVYLKMVQRMRHLRQGCVFESMMLYGHTDRVMALYYHEGKIATGSDDRSVRVWDGDTGTCLKIFQTHTVSDIKFDDNYLVTASFDTTAACWDMDSGELLQRYTGHVAAVFSIDYNDELDVLVTGSADSTVKCWALLSGAILRTLPQHRSAWITQVRLSWNPQDGSTDKYFILSRDVGSVHMWQMDRRSHEMCHNEEWTNPYNDLVPGLQLDGGEVSFATVDTSNSCYVVRTSLRRMTETERRRSCALSKDACLECFLGCGAHFDVLLCRGDQSHINVIRHSTGDVVASLPLNVDYRPSKRGSTYTLGECGWLDGLDGRNDRGVFFATSVRDNGVYLLKWRRTGGDLATGKELDALAEAVS